MVWVESASSLCRDLDGIRAAVVHLELRRLEVPDAQRDGPFAEKRVREPEALVAHGALVLAEELEGLGFAGIHDEESGEAHREDQEREERGDDARHALAVQ